MCFLGKRAEDQPKSPPSAANTDLVPLEASQQEVEKPIKVSTVVAQEILGCHSALAISSFLCSGTFVESSSAPY